jgi:hypothetical protein
MSFSRSTIKELETDLKQLLRGRDKGEARINALKAILEEANTDLRPKVSVLLAHKASRRRHSAAKDLGASNGRGSLRATLESILNQTPDLPSKRDL